MAMSNDDIFVPNRPRTERPSSTGRAQGRSPVIDQDGHEIPDSTLRGQFESFRIDFGHSSANPFGNLTREQRMARLDALSKRWLNLRQTWDLYGALHSPEARDVRRIKPIMRAGSRLAI